MELVEGPTLADRIRGGPIALDEALPIARQVAEAVEYAHDKNVIHRDLKPANIKVKPDGMVKVLDFGLAKALSDDPAEESMSNSPTLSMAATRQGVILGTAAYMAPEQAKGKSVDRRADVWAFGVVFYEMLTGKQLFTGDSIAETLASVMKESPSFELLPKETPSAIRNLLRRCLERNTKRRLPHIGEARIILEDVLSGAFPGNADLPIGAVAPPPPLWRRAMPAAITLCLGAGRPGGRRRLVLHQARARAGGAHRDCHLRCNGVSHCGPRPRCGYLAGRHADASGGRAGASLAGRDAGEVIRQYLCVGGPWLCQPFV